jgi:hypothetical protein
MTYFFIEEKLADLVAKSEELVAINKTAVMYWNRSNRRRRQRWWVLWDGA